MRSLIESRDGLHLSAYLKRQTEPGALEAQLNEVVRAATEHVRPVLEAEDADRFLRPIRLLARDQNFLKRINGNFAIFRNKDLFRILTIPIEIDELCVVATSFHVKPLLRWMQVNKEFLLLGLERGAATLYHGNLTSFTFVDAAIIPQVAEGSLWLNQWINQMTRSNRPRLFVAGEPAITERLFGEIKYRNLYRPPIADRFQRSEVPNLCDQIRSVLAAEAKKTVSDSILEFHIAEEAKMAKKNIFQIAKGVIQGRVRKLIVADGVQIFGKIDPLTGGLSIHPVEIDHEDDDILDDLAQAVIRQGGEVVVARREEIPKGFPLMAIFDRQGGEAAARPLGA